MNICILIYCILGIFAGIGLVCYGSELKYQLTYSSLKNEEYFQKRMTSYLLNIAGILFAVASGIFMLCMMNEICK